MDLSFSRATTMHTCGRKYHMIYNLGYKSMRIKINMPWSNAIHFGVEQYLKANAFGAWLDPVDPFMEKLDEELKSKQVVYQENWNLNDYEECGKALMTMFPDTWEALNYEVVLTNHGEPMVEQNIRIPLEGTSHNLQMRLDQVIREKRTGALAIFDTKSASQEPSVDFGENSVQLTTYQHGWESMFLDKYGPISNVGFLTFLKRKPKKSVRSTGPAILPSCFARRSEAKVEDMLYGYKSIATDIDQQRFGRPFSNAFNSPCNTCEFNGFCTRNDSTGLMKTQRGVTC